MSTIDERIVEMRFNNKRFEQGISQSIKSLNHLKGGLDLENSGRSLTRLGRIANTFSLSNISNGVDTLTQRFSTLGIVGITAIQNLTNSAINAGKKMIKALTIDPVTTGFNEYETKMNAIKTILANTEKSGTTLEQVNEALAALNEYSDNTVYNFAQMTDMVGKFAAKTGELDSSVNMVQGLANLAALSGVDNTRLQGALYQVSQMAETVKSLDWMSLDTAGLSTLKFREDLIAMAKTMGTIDVKTLNELESGTVSFRDTLKEDWLTKGVFSGVTAMYALDEEMTKAAGEVTTFTKLMVVMEETVQSGWATTWEAIVGDRKESSEFLTGIAEGFKQISADSANARNDVLSFWKENGGRDEIIAGLSNSFQALKSILKPISEALREFFPRTTGQQLLDFSKGFRELTERFKIGEDTLNNIRRTFRGLFAVLDIGKQAIFALGNGLLNLIRYFAPAGSGILSFTGDIGDFLVAINKALKSSDAFNKVVEKIGTVLSFVADRVKSNMDKIKNAFKSLSEIDTSGIDKFFDRFKARIKPISGLTSGLVFAFDKMVQGVKKIAPLFYKLGAAISDAFSFVRDKLFTGLNNANFNTIFDTLNSGVFVAILFGIKKFIKSLTDITDSAGGFVGQFTGILDGVKGSLEAYQSQLKANILIKIAIALGILAASLVAISMIDSAKLTTALTAMAVMFGELFGSLALFNKVIAGPGFVGMAKMVVAMLGLSTSVLILSFALSKIARLDYDGIAKGLLAIAALSATMVASAKLLSASSGPLIRASVSLVIFSTAINILVSAVKKLGNLDTETLIKGLVGVGVLLAEMAVFTKVIGGGKSFITTAISIGILGTAMLIFGKAIKNMGNMSWGEIARGLTTLAGSLTILAAAMTYMPSAIPGAAGLVIVSGALMLLTPTLQKLGNMKWGEIGKSLTILAGALAIIAGAMYLMPAAIPGALALVVVSGALLLLVPSLEKLGNMQWDEIARGLTVLAGSLGIIALAMFGMTAAIPGALALGIVSASLLALAPVLLIFGNMAWGEIGKGLLMLAGALTVIGLAGLVLTPVIPSLLGLAGAVALLGVGLSAVGAGVLLFSAGMTALAVSGAAGAVGLTAIVSAIIGLIPFALKQLAEGIVGMVKTLGDGIPVILTAVTKIVIGILDTIDDLAPRIIDTLDILINKLLDFLEKNFPRFVKVGFSLLISLLKGIRDNIGEVLAIALEIISNFLDGISAKIPDIINSGINLLISFINGMAEGIRKNTDRMIAAIENLIGALIEAAKKILIAAIPGFAGVWSDIIESGFIQGIKQKTSDFVDTVIELPTKAIGAIKTKISEFKNVGVDLVRGFIDGIKSQIVDAKNWASNLASSTLNVAKSTLGIESPSKVFKEVGEMIGKGMAEGIKNSTPVAVDATSDMATKAVAAAKEAFQNSLDWIDERKYYNQLSLSEELAAWERVQKRYIQGTDERKKADREAYRVRQEMANAEFQNSLGWIDDRKHYNQLSLSEELDAWERVQARYLRGTDERKKADREVYRLKQEINKTNEEYTNQVLDVEKDANKERIRLENEYYSKTKEINDRLKNDIRRVTDEYNNAVKSRADTIYRSYGLFDKIEQDQEVSGSDLVKDLEDQVKAFDNWQVNITELAKKGISDGLVEELRDMGPKSNAQIKALNSLSDTELTKYANLWQEKHNSAKTQAILELEDMRLRTVDQINTMEIDADRELREYNMIWANQMITLKNETINRLTELKNEWFSKIGSIRSETEVEFVLMTENVKKTVNNAGWSELGNNIVGGMIAGIRSKSRRLAMEAAYVARAALNAAKSALGIRSPSKEFAKLGEFSGEGFIQGLKSYTSSIINTTKDMGQSSVEGLRNVLASVSDIVNSNIDSNPVIRPVLDLTDITNGAKNIGGLFNTTAGISTRNISVPNITTNDSVNPESISPDGKATNVSFVQNNYSPKPLSRLEIYRQTRNQISTLKGVVNPV